MRVRQHSLFLLAIILLAPLAVLHAQTVVWVSDDKSGNKLDQEWLDIMIRSGYEVNQDFSDQEGRSLSASEVDQLNAADLIIISRDSNSGHYATNAAEVDQWNQIDTPLILMNAYIARSNRWKWLDTTSAVKIGSGALPDMEIAVGQDNHPIFKGFGFNDDNYTISLITGSQSFLNIEDKGNGTLLSYRQDNFWPWIVLFEPGQEFYAGSGQTPAARRLYFCAGLDSPDGQVNVSRDGLVMFLNAADFMIGKSNPMPSLPEPGLNAIIDDTQPTLFWRSGALADSHKVYLSEDQAAVESLSDDALLVTTEKAEVVLSEALTPGATYYWRSVEVSDNNGEGPWIGSMWSFTVRPVKAWEPVPADQMQWVKPDQLELQWSLGLDAVAHQVYLSQDQQAVQDGADAAKLGLTTDPNWVVDGLTENTTYFWRVDEVQTNGTTTAGDVWQFTTVDSKTVEGLLGNYFTNVRLSDEPTLSRTDPNIDFGWGTVGPDPSIGLENYSVRWNGELQVPLTDTYQIIARVDDGVRLWLDGKQLIDNWQNGGARDSIGMADLEAGQTYSIQMEYYQAGGGASARLLWTSDQIQRMIIPDGALLLPVRTYNPSPAGEAIDVLRDSTLAWQTPDNGTQVDVYFGTDYDAVMDATPETAGVYQQRQSEKTWNPGPLAWNQTYHWRIDLVQNDTVVKGVVWSFTTANFVLVDGFESYADEEGRWVYETWMDGFGGTEALGGSTAGHLDPTMETQNIFAGYQALPFYYDNDGSFTDYFGKMTAPIKSEIVRDFDTPQDWTSEDGVALNALQVWVRGREDIADNADNGNTPDGLYIMIEDADGKVATIAHADNPQSVLVTEYVAWAIPYTEITAAGVDLTKVQKLTIGVGQASGEARGEGILYIDNISLWPEISEN